MREIVFATNNPHKLSEMRSIAADVFVVRSLEDIGCAIDIPETGNTLESNALQKAQFVKEHFGYDCFADDTGLEVNALDGAPGVHSARYAPGEGHDAKANSRLLLENMQDKDDRRARFRTVIALVQDGHEDTLFEGIVEGRIARQECGDGGFGYDPLFIPEGYDISFAQMAPEQKNAISHRGRATRRLMEYLCKENNK